MDTIVLPAASSAPRGTDFHYAGCGCGCVPHRAHLGGGVDWIWHPASIVAVNGFLRRDGGVRQKTAEAVVGPSASTRHPCVYPYPRLRIAYFLPHHNVTGGLKLLLQQIVELKRRGHHVTVLYRSADAAGPQPVAQGHASAQQQLPSVLPPWAGPDLHAAVDTQILVPRDTPLKRIIDGLDVDILMVGYFTQLEELCDRPWPWGGYHDHGTSSLADPTLNAANAAGARGHGGTYGTNMYSSSSTSSTNGRSSSFMMARPPIPILYWEQGHEHVFGDHDPQSATSQYWDAIYHASMHLPVVLTSVSEAVSDILRVHFGRVAPVIPNAIRADEWAGANMAPGKQPAPAVADRTSAHAAPPRPQYRVLLVGNPYLPLKNFGTAFKVLNIVGAYLSSLKSHVDGNQQHSTSVPAADAYGQPPQASLPLHSRARARGPSPRLAVTWICQAPPPASLLQAAMHDARASALPFDLHLIVNPPQAQLPFIYTHGRVPVPSSADATGHGCGAQPQQHYHLNPVFSAKNTTCSDGTACFDALLFTSVYEGFAMPVLEAMASGIPVVTSACHGISSFCEQTRNSLIADAEDVNGLAACLLQVLFDEGLAATLASNGVATARRLSWERTTMPTLECAMTQAHFLLGRGRAVLQQAGIDLQALEANTRPAYRLVAAGNAVVPAIELPPPAPLQPLHPHT